MAESKILCSLYDPECFNSNIVPPQPDARVIYLHLISRYICGLFLARHTDVSLRYQQSADLADIEVLKSDAAIEDKKGRKKMIDQNRLTRKITSGKHKYLVREM